MRLVHWFALLLLAIPAGCATRPLTANRAGSSEVPRGINNELAIARCTEQMEKSVEGMRRLMNSSGRESDFLQPREHDFLEKMLAEYLTCRRELELISERESHNSNLAGDSLRRKTKYDVELVSLSVDDPVLWRAMNQAYYRSNIPAESCDRILLEVTATREPNLTKEHREQIGRVISRRSMLLPAVENEVRHAWATRVLWDAGGSVSGQIRRCKNALVTCTGRIKNPVARSLTISDEQRQEIREALQPGDVLLTYTEGYASNLFIPGNFKHAATFVGTPRDRQQAGLPPDLLLAVAGPNPHALAQVLAQTMTKTGEAADVVESVAEGVQLCNFDRLLGTRVNRLVVLRPQLSPEERAEQVADVMSYVGDEYDFSFDLTDASDQVCTEVVYRSLQGRGGIDLPLSEHAWCLTLTADDILRCCVRDDGQRFACILVVDEAQDSSGNARILRAAEAQEWLSRLPGIGK